GPVALSPLSLHDALPICITADVRVRKLDIIFSTASSSLLGADRILLIYFGALAIMTNNMSVGMLIAFHAYRDQFTNRIGGLVDRSEEHTSELQSRENLVC